MTCFSFLFRKKTLPPPRGAADIEEEVSGVHVIRYPYKELQIATDCFSAVNKIGEGGFGSVYRGKLKDGTIAAIKVLSTESRQGVREFLTELNVIADIEHENLVNLLGCCVEGDNRILIYPYLENNSLARTLLGGGHHSIQFSWETRSKICVDVAKGLAFLHDEVQPHIVHRDIKASNILLDKNLTAKISDFGLAKLFPGNMTHVSTRVAGTAGYLAPEYAIRGQLTRKADVYSFGVLLLEIISGRSNKIARLPDNEQYLLEKAWKLYKANELLKLVDISLNGNFDIEEACRYLKIGLLCTQEMPKLRPSMPTVVQMLTAEVGVDDEPISKPSLLNELLGIKTSSCTESASSSKLDDSSVPPEIRANSYATMSFDSIYDRSD